MYHISDKATKHNMIKSIYPLCNYIMRAELAVVAPEHKCDESNTRKNQWATDKYLQSRKMVIIDLDYWSLQIITSY